MFKEPCLLFNCALVDGVPYDGSPVQEIDSHHLGLVIVYAMLAFAGLIYAAICLAFNVIFRKRLYVACKLCLTMSRGVVDMLHVVCTHAGL